MKTMKIIVCCHKKDVMATQKPYMPIHVGKSTSSIILDIQADNEGESISEKNSSYCELTGLYWAWKNLKNVDFIGLCHYRRYFDFHHQCDSVMPETPYPTEHFNKLDLSVPEFVINSIQNGVAYVSKPRFYRHSLYEDYCCSHLSDDIRTLEKYIMLTQSESIKRAWFEYMHRNCQLRHYNMFIMTWHDFDAYCSWLFPLLQEMEKRINISHYTSVQRRIFGYMAERLMNVWLLANRFKLYEQPIIWFCDYPGQASRNHLKYYRNLIRSKLALAITRGKYNNFKQIWQ